MNLLRDGGLIRAGLFSGYMMGLNPFVQPGVEAYKKAVFALAGKPGYEEQREAMGSALKTRERIIV